MERLFAFEASAIRSIRPPARPNALNSSTAARRMRFLVAAESRGAISRSLVTIRLPTADWLLACPLSELTSYLGIFVQQRTLGQQGLTTGAIGLGTMGMSMAYGPGGDEAASEATIQRAHEL